MSAVSVIEPLNEALCSCLETQDGRPSSELPPLTAKRSAHGGNACLRSVRRRTEFYLGRRQIANVIPLFISVCTVQALTQQPSSLERSTSSLVREEKKKKKSARKTGSARVHLSEMELPCCCWLADSPLRFSSRKVTCFRCGGAIYAGMLTPCAGRSRTANVGARSVTDRQTGRRTDGEGER